MTTYQQVSDMYSDICCYLERRDLWKSDEYQHAARKRVGSYLPILGTPLAQQGARIRVLRRYHRLLVSTGRIPCPTVQS